MLKVILSGLLLLLSMLILFRAPTHFFWLVAVAITSFPYVPMLLTIILFFIGGKETPFHWPVMIMNTIAFIIFSLPVIAAYTQKTYIAVRMEKIFPVKSVGALSNAFSFLNMFSNNKRIAFQTIIYKEIDHKKLSADFYPAISAKLAPLVIVIHGGSWESGDNKQLPELNSYLACKGYNVASINYRLAPAYKAPAPVEDTKDAIQYFILHAATFKIDTNNIVLLGRSAGGQIALCAAYTLHVPNIKGVINYYGPADMVWGGQIKVNDLVLNTDRIYTNYFGGLYNQMPDKFKESSATNQADKMSPPTLMIHGTIDPMVSFHHEARLQKRLNELHIKNYFLKLPFATHGCDYSLQSPAGQLSTYATEHFLNSVTGQSWKN